MEEKKLNSQESLAIITEMIDRTKSRLHMGDGNMLLLWGYLTVGITALVWGLLHIYPHSLVLCLFFLIWIIGSIGSARISARTQVEKGVTTYTDRISQSVWRMVGWSSIILTLVCLLLTYGFNKYSSWNSMYVYPLLIVGMAESFQGIVINEKSLVRGGFVGITAGLATLAMLTGGVKFNLDWFFPMFILSFICMLIVPGHILNHKAKSLCSRN